MVHVVNNDIKKKYEEV